MVDGKIMCIVILLIVALVLFGGCTGMDERVISQEYIGGKYGAKIVTLEITSENERYEIKEIYYSVGNKQYRGDYKTEPPFPDSIAWIRNNTPESSGFLNWWDYGHMIRGASGRDVIIAGPSKKIAGSTISVISSGKMDERTYEKKYGFEPDDRVRDVALALTTDNITAADQIMDRYNVSYIYTTVYDLDIIDAMLAASTGDRYGDYYTDYHTEIGQGRQTVPSMKFYNSTMARLHLFKGKGLKNYRLVFESQPVMNRTREKWYRYTYNVLYDGNSQVEDSGYVKIYEYLKDAR